MARLVRRVVCFGAAVGVAFAFGVAPASAHNWGCVQTGTGEWVPVGSETEAPLVGEGNPHYHAALDEAHGQLDLQEGPGDQYGTRYAADQGNSAVELPGLCARR